VSWAAVEVSPTTARARGVLQQGDIQVTIDRRRFTALAGSFGLAAGLSKPVAAAVKAAGGESAGAATAARARRKGMPMACGPFVWNLESAASGGIARRRGASGRWGVRRPPGHVVFGSQPPRLAAVVRGFVAEREGVAADVEERPAAVGGPQVRAVQDDPVAPASLVNLATEA
jgi:hypothetical protein